MKRALRSGAFTLIELLVVISIIIIIASILLPVIFAARNKARQLECASNLRQIGMAIQLYAADHDDVPPIGGYNSATPPPMLPVASLLPIQTSAGSMYRVDWRDVLLGMNYMAHKSVFTCPMDVDPNKDYHFSYGINRWVLGWMGSSQLDTVISPSLTALASEKRGPDWPIWLPNERVGNPYYLPMDPRHSNALNVLYCDGHIRSVAVGENIQTDKTIWRWQP